VNEWGWKWEWNTNKSTKNGNNSNDTLSQGANIFLAQFTWIVGCGTWGAIECLGVVALSVEMFGVPLVFSSILVGGIYCPNNQIWPLQKSNQNCTVEWRTGPPIVSYRRTTGPFDLWLVGYHSDLLGWTITDPMRHKTLHISATSDLTVEIWNLVVEPCMSR
jgi:hypothetical protein